MIERGVIKEKKGEKFIVESLDRRGIVTPEIPPLYYGKIEINGNTYKLKEDFAAGDYVYFFLFADGEGGIISKIPR